MVSLCSVTIYSQDSVVFVWAEEKAAKFLSGNFQCQEILSVELVWGKYQPGKPPPDEIQAGKFLSGEIVPGKFLVEEILALEFLVGELLPREFLLSVCEVTRCVPSVSVAFQPAPINLW